MLGSGVFVAVGYMTWKAAWSLVWAAASAAAMQVHAAPLRDHLMSIPLSEALGGDTTRPVATADAFTFIAGNATPSHRSQFSLGNQTFTATWQPAPGPEPTTDGLGPLFNRDSCFACHNQNGRGRPPASAEDRMETMLIRWSVPGADGHGGPAPVPAYGDQLQDRAIDTVAPEAQVRVYWSAVVGRYADGTRYRLRKPAYRIAQLAYGPLPPDVMTSGRISNPVIGLGLLEAVPEATLAALADPEDRDGDGISGRLNMVWDAPSGRLMPGRFGWKANAATLSHQNAAAARNDMGLSTPVFPSEACETGQEACLAAVQAAGPAIEMEQGAFTSLEIYMRLLGVPRQRNAAAPEVRRGEEAFRALGCAACHMPTLQTDGQADLEELRNQTFHPFTDLLVHDMGPGLSDGRPDYLAGPRDWRTAPLWGIGLTRKVSGFTAFLHDGRARDLAEAILWHGGEGEQAKERFRRAPRTTREDLLAFLNSL